MTHSGSGALRDAIERVVSGSSLDSATAEGAMAAIMQGEATDAQVAGYLVALRMKGETVDEVVGSARAMRAAASRIAPSRTPLVDTCGTGGDASGTFNISTGAALVVAAAGAAVAKHGNRSVSSQCGSADVLEALGIPVDVEPARAEMLVDRHGFGFLFAPRFHGAMRHAMGPRRQLAMRTVFNLLGPLTNPAGAACQVMGVYSPEIVDLAAAALLGLGVERAFVVHSADGLDEVSLCAPTHYAEVANGEVRRGVLNASDFGMEPVKREDLAGGDAEMNAGILERIAAGEKGAPRSVVVANASLALVACGMAADFRDGAKTAAAALDEGRVAHLLAALRAESA